MGVISVDINNGQIMKLIQKGHDGNILLYTGDSEAIDKKDYHGCNEYRITAGELVMLMNYFCNCKMGKEKSDYITETWR